ncbi:hypothetical protein [Streptacidiphilus jiangxiensis]|uniref:Uncharacterized protein n=1 Tax=Streptacidiphilus jiangxiensis TaxID=235985 RepID=A0A1H7T796_STRJI|nr:hypothetical protein [Streptacidiphilus jiangxiensis]SEL80214.1 hypothetical protein SAMN05414137_11393 [Streptacidiphilus jiangxiensis]
MFRGRRVPDELLPVLMLRTWVEVHVDRAKARARQVHSTRDLGALSFELVAIALLLLGLVLVLVGILTKAITAKANKVH